MVVRSRRVIKSYGLGIELDRKLCHRGQWWSGALDWALSDVQRVTKVMYNVLQKVASSARKCVLAEHCRAASWRRRLKDVEQSEVSLFFLLDKI